MTRKWSLRLFVMGAVALALGCRTHPAVPVCTTPLYPEDVVRLSPAGRPAMAAGPAAPSSVARLESAKLPDGSSDDPASVVPPKDVAATLTSRAKPVPPVVKPLLVDAPRPKPGEDGFAPGPRVPADSSEPDLRLPDPKPAPAAPVTPLKPGEKFGHAPDYRWVAGTLDRHQKGGYWTLRYADIGDDDPWGGKVRLLESDRLKDLRDGDVVYIEGDLLAPASAAASAAYPPYRVTALAVVEKAP
jgi:hypothetical protein